jgi:hypothetical protein
MVNHNGLKLSDYQAPGEFRYQLRRFLLSAVSSPDVTAQHVAIRAFVSVVPLRLILSSLGLIFLYHHNLLDSLTQFSERGAMAPRRTC